MSPFADSSSPWGVDAAGAINPNIIRFPTQPTWSSGELATNMSIINLMVDRSPPIPTAAAEVVHVKYRGSVDLAPFACEWTPRSSVVKRLCYAKERYVVVNLTGMHYHYGEVPAPTISPWRTADSLGRFFNARIKGSFDYRVLRVPGYKS
jgi:hypothetical protein